MKVSQKEADDISSAFVKWLMNEEIRKKEKLAIWLDNCNVQCKNWYVYTCLATFINSGATNLVEIKLRYFEKGHTFMSVDSYHHMFEKIDESYGKCNNS